jgi:hypothetical protein
VGALAACVTDLTADIRDFGDTAAIIFQQVDRVCAALPQMRGQAASA